MAITQITDVVVPQEFTDYTVKNNVVSTAFSKAGVMVPNGVMQSSFPLVLPASPSHSVRTCRTWQQASPRIMLKPRWVQPNFRPHALPFFSGDTI